jgi:hypothetical protein
MTRAPVDYFIPDEVDPFIPDEVDSLVSREPNAAPSDATGGAKPAPNMNRAWGRTLKRATPGLVLDALEMAAGKAGGVLGGPLGSYGAGVIARAARWPIETLMGRETPVPFSLDALRSLNEAGNAQFINTGLGMLGKQGVETIGRGIGRRALNPPASIKRESAETLMKQTQLADRVIARRLPGGVLESAEASAVARNQAGRVVRRGLRRAGKQSTTGTPPKWSTVGGPNAMRVREDNLRHTMPQWERFGKPPSKFTGDESYRRMHPPASPGIPKAPPPGKPVGFAFDPMEMRPAVSRTLSRMRAAKAPQDEINAVERRWREFLAQNPGNMTPLDLKRFKQGKFKTGRTILKAHKESGSAPAIERAGAELDVELGREANRMLRRIPGYREAEGVVKNRIFETKTLERAALRGASPISLTERLTGPLTHVTRSYRTSRALTNPQFLQTVEQTPRMLDYTLRELLNLSGMNDVPADTTESDYPSRR